MSGQIDHRSRLAAVHDTYHVFAVEQGFLAFVEGVELRRNTSCVQPVVYEGRHIIFMEIGALELHKLPQERNECFP